MLETEIKGLQQLENYIDENFCQACDMLLRNISGKAIVMGMGKSGHIGKKIAATLAEYGHPCFLSIPEKPLTAIWG
ncbi:hypothetical protein P4S72_04895 [Vibrio sp. PP-XX7]